MTDSSDNRGASPDISIVIVNWNTCEELRACLGSIADTGAVASETFVIDNASTDGSAEMVRREYPSVRLIENARNLGFAKASNQGIAESTGRFIILLNPDTEVRPRALQSLVRFGDANPDIGVFGPKILNLDESVYPSCRRFPTFAAGLFRNTILGKYFPRNTYLMDYLMAGWDHSETKDVDWVSGAALTFRRDLLEEIGPLDERFFMYCEDVDFAYRAKQKGRRVAYFPGAVVVHARGRSSDKNPDRMIIVFHRSMYRFYKKHYIRRYLVFLRLIVPLGLIARASFFIGRNVYRHYRHRILGRFTRAKESAKDTRAHGERTEKEN